MGGGASKKKKAEEVRRLSNVKKAATDPNFEYYSDGGEEPTPVVGHLQRPSLALESTTGSSSRGADLEILTRYHLDAIALELGLSIEHVEALYERFKVLDCNCDGRLSHQDLAFANELAVNPFCETLFELMTLMEKGSQKDSSVSFKSFATILAAFDESRSTADIIGALFNLFDLGGDVELDRRTMVDLVRFVTPSMEAAKADALAVHYLEAGAGPSAESLTRADVIQLMAYIPNVQDAVSAHVIPRATS